MKHLLFTAAVAIAALAPLSLPAQAADYAWPVVRVIDGDTIVVDASADMPAELADLRVRLRGIDAPETGHRAKCEAERAAGNERKAFAEDMLDAAETVVVRDPEWGKWGGRVVADVILDGKHSLADWTGLGMRDWCGEGASAVDFRAEIDRHVVDPCIEAALADKSTFPEARALYGEAGLARVAKMAGAGMIAEFERVMRPFVPHREWEFRAKVYEVFDQMCIAEIRRSARGGGGY